MALHTPSRIETKKENSNVTIDSESVLGKARASSSATGCRLCMEVPRSPCRMSFNQLMYSTSKGSYNPNSSLFWNSCSSEKNPPDLLKMISAGSLGKRWIRRNERNVMPKKVKINWNIFANIRLFIFHPSKSMAKQIRSANAESSCFRCQIFHVTMVKGQIDNWCDTPRYWIADQHRHKRRMKRHDNDNP